MKVCKAVTILAVVALLAGSAGAGIISANFKDSSSGELAPEDVAGVVSAANWNNLQDPGNTTPMLFEDLIDSTGATTPVDLTLVKENGDTSNTGSSAQSTSNGTLADRVMMSEGWGAKGSGADITLQIRNLPQAYADAGVNIYIYTWGGGTESEGSGHYLEDYQFSLDAGQGVVPVAWIQNFNETGTALDDQDDNPGKKYQNEENPKSYDPWPGYLNNQAADLADSGSSSYALVHVEGETDFDILVSSTNRAWLTGMQIEVVPEPATMSLLALGGLGALIRRRK